MQKPNYRLGYVDAGEVTGRVVSSVVLRKNNQSPLAEKTFGCSCNKECTRDCSCDSDCKSHCHCHNDCRSDCSCDSECRKDCASHEPAGTDSGAFGY